MKCFRRCFCLLLCFALLLGVSSVGVAAVEVSVNSYHVYISGSLKLGSTDYAFTGVNVYPGNGTEEKASKIISFNGSVYGGWELSTTWAIATDDGSTLVSGERSVTFKLNNAYYSYLFEAGGDTFYDKDPSSVRVLIYYVDGTYEYLDGISWTVNTSTGRADLSFTFTPEHDVTKFEVIIKDIGSTSSGTSTVQSYYGEYSGDDKWQITIDQESEEVGLLGGLIQWVKDLYNKTVSGFNGLVTAIADLPILMWEKIEDGLTRLVVPSDDFMDGFKDDMDALLADRFGAVYQVVNITLESWDRITANDQSNTVSIPVVTIPLPGDNEFSFGGYDVPIVPQGFDFLAIAVKTMSGIVCTVAFVNGLRKRYDEVMGVEK